MIEKHIVSLIKVSITLIYIQDVQEQLKGLKKDLNNILSNQSGEVLETWITFQKKSPTTASVFFLGEGCDTVSWTTKL